MWHFCGVSLYAYDPYLSCAVMIASESSGIRGQEQIQRGGGEEKGECIERKRDSVGEVCVCGFIEDNADETLNLVMASIMQW